MITDLIISFLSAPLWAIVQGLSFVGVSFELPDYFTDIFVTLTKCVGYILPIELLFTLIGIQLAFHGFRLTWNIILRVKSFIPTMGG